MKKIITMAVLAFLLLAGVAYAIPNLQIYIEGATYDPVSQSWITDQTNFKLWVLSDVSGGNKTGVYDVKLSAAFLASESGIGSITLTPTTVTSGLLPSPGDTSTPGAPVLYTAVPQVGTQPVMGDGSLLPSHGIYGTGIDWLGYNLGDMIAQDSPIGDYITSAPPATWPDMGQINAYNVTVTGFSEVHFDAFDHYVNASSGNFSYVNAPFSHDADTVPGGGPPPFETPEPGTLILVGCGLLAFAIHGRKGMQK